MIRTLNILLAIWIAIFIAVFAIGFAHAQDNNPFSGATSISVEMVREEQRSFRQTHKSLPGLKRNKSNRLGGALNFKRSSFRLRCTLDGRPINWKERGRHYRLRLAGESIDVPPDAAGPMMVLLWAGGARCR